MNRASPGRKRHFFEIEEPEKNLDSFKENHNAPNPFTCDQCDFKTNAKKYLNKHIKANHLKLKPYKCDQCSYSS